MKGEGRGGNEIGQMIEKVGCYAIKIFLCNPHGALKLTRSFRVLAGTPDVQSLDAGCS